MKVNVFLVNNNPELDFLVNIQTMLMTTTTIEIKNKK